MGGVGDRWNCTFDITTLNSVTQIILIVTFISIHNNIMYENGSKRCIAIRKNGYNEFEYHSDFKTFPNLDRLWLCT